MRLKDLANKRVALIGFEATNRSLFYALRSVCPNLWVEIRDLRTTVTLPEDPFVTHTLGETYLDHLQTFDVIIRSPGVRYWPQLQAVQSHVTTSLNLFFDEVRSTTTATMIGVTGTKGKSTTATLLAHVLREAGKAVTLIGNMDIQEWDHLHEINDDTIVVYEMSSYMLEDFNNWPDIALLLPLYPDHMDWHGSFAAYTEAKSRITARQTSENMLIFPAKNAEALSIAKQTDATTIPVQIVSGLHWQNGFFFDGTQQLFSTNALPLPGEHWLDDALLVLAVVKQLDIPFDRAQRAFTSFKGLPHRLEVVATINQVTYVDDAISTTPESTIAAVKAFDTVGSIVLGGMDRGYDYVALAQLLTERHVPNVLLFPGAREKFQHALTRAQFAGSVILVESMQEVVSTMAQCTPAGSVALLSTAAPSYDQFKNYKDQGQQFVDCVRKLS